jgi:hypothetical protein
LSIIQAIESCCHVIAAADEFQDLQKTGPSAAVEWLHGGAGKKNILTSNRRTNDATLLKAADRLRTAQDCGDILQGTLMSALNANVAAAHIARNICWKKPKDAVILTPTGPDKSPFVRDAVARLTTKSIKPKGITPDVGPFRIVWESNMGEEKAALLSKLGCLSQGVGMEKLREICLNQRGPLGDLCQWAERKLRVKGQLQFSDDELTTAVDRILQARRSFLPTSYPGRIRAMTINQAKNREFEGVIILWPLALGGDLESQRRRLYNALTRAQKWAIVIVQDALTLTRTKNLEMAQDIYSFGGGHPIKEEHLILPESVVENFNAPLSKVLKPMFDLIWNACGFLKSKNFDDEGNRKPQRQVPHFQMPSRGATGLEVPAGDLFSRTPSIEGS